MRSLDSPFKIGTEIRARARRARWEGWGWGGGGEKVPGTRREVPIYPPFSSQSIEIHHLHPRALEFRLFSNLKWKTVWSMYIARTSKFDRKPNFQIFKYLRFWSLKWRFLEFMFVEHVFCMCLHPCETKLGKILSQNFTHFWPEL